MFNDGTFPLILRQIANILHTILLIVILFASYTIIKKERDTKQQPRCQKPCRSHDQERTKLVLTFTSYLINQLLQWRQLESVVLFVMLRH